MKGETLRALRADSWWGPISFFLRFLLDRIIEGLPNFDSFVTQFGFD